MEELKTPQEPGRSDNVLIRAFAAEVTPGDGRTADVRIVPYGQRIVHNDGHGGVPKGMPYTEEWMPGSFAKQAKATGREREVRLKFGHNDGMRDIVGHGLMFREAADGFYGSFRFLDDSDGDKALLLVREGVITGLSLEAQAKSVRSSDGVVRRIRGHLRAVALTDIPAYDSARVLALREEFPNDVLDESLLPITPNPETIERCRHLGIKLPQRYQAHPAETDTPAKSGTSGDGTRQAQKT